ncbi:hypothetical protein [Spiroplasma ixodetis]|uniref:hypothetical protein n=1 Tax=Spiroplasma ixodetis TaxID=2141 RepID=UPI002575B467|nr:hypothetical protein [Spiroplasma ixodetis]WJG69874.1 hypothetical protein SIXOD_v1c08610 [Spiroplasma ixodetis Y32]
MKKIKNIEELIKEIKNINIRNEKNENIPNPYFDKIITILKMFKITELNYQELKNELIELSQQLRDDKTIYTNKEFMPIFEKINIVIKFLEKQENNKNLCNDWHLILNIDNEQSTIEQSNSFQEQILETTPLLQQDQINSINNEQNITEQSKCFKCCLIM